MTYQVLSLKWRPQSFEDVIGQDHVTRTLGNAFKKDRVAQAYLLTGPRGVGKTTTARIIAKALNCIQASAGNPCNECNVCQEITDGRNLDVLEIDGASNRGIEEIRNLREQIKYAPMNGPYKIFIIDEVHMLTNQAFNALLTTLEEPPAHGKFILATTDIHKVPSTIISRCQRFDFNRITDPVISARLSKIMQAEKLIIDDESLAAISRKAEGSMRDALSILDQVIAFAGEEINFSDVSTVIGLIPVDIYFEFSLALEKRNSAKLLKVLNNIKSTGFALEDVAQGLNLHFRNLLVATIENSAEILGMTKEQSGQYLESSKAWTRKDLLRCSKILNDLEFSLKKATQPNILFDMTALKLLEMDRAVSIENLLNRDGFENQRNKAEEIPENPPVKINKNPVQEIKKLEKITELRLEETTQLPQEKVRPETELKLNRNSEEASGEIETKKRLDEIKNGWTELVAAVNIKRPSIGMVLEHSRPEKLIGNRLTVFVFDLPKFSVRTLEKNQIIIENFLEEKFELKLKIIGEWQPGENPQDQKLEIKTGGNYGNKEDPVINRIIEQFDGEILR
ncbi:MAG: DNA polymerase III subunit gamma/tau [Candidatus Neomarinimicrobiota bacterium]